MERSPYRVSFDWLEDNASLLLGAVVLILIIVTATFVFRWQGEAATRCERAGGVYFSREGKCLDVREIHP